MSPRVAVYGRYSSDNQRETSIEDQLSRCTRFIHDQGWQLDPELVFTDSAISAASDDRPGFQQMRQLIVNNPRGIDILVLESADRLARNLGDADRLYREVDFAQVRLICITDGIDTERKGARFAFTLKAVMSDHYLELLGEATMRGLEECMAKGFSTGGLPFGYRSRPVGVGKHKKGYLRCVDDDAAAIVVRIFELYRDGLSCRSIAKLLNEDQVPPPRPVRKKGRKGWVSSTIREMLHNESYIGKWSFKKRKWRKVPGTNDRRSIKLDKKDIMVGEFPDLRIIPQELWVEVRERRNAVATKYKAGKGKKKGKQGRGAPGRRTDYPFSGLLTCGGCGAPMVIIGGSSARYYRCGDNHKRGTCDNAVSVREEDVRSNMVAGLEELLIHDNAVVYASKQLSTRLGERGRRLDDERRRIELRLADLARQTQNLIAFLKDSPGDAVALEPVRESLEEIHQKRQRFHRELVMLKASEDAPVVLPTAEQVRGAVFDLKAAIEADPIRAREALRRLFGDGLIVLEPQEDRSYIAKTDVLPLMVIPAAKRTKPPSDGSPGACEQVVYNDGCAGRI